MAATPVAATAFARECARAAAMRDAVRVAPADWTDALDALYFHGLFGPTHRALARPGAIQAPPDARSAIAAEAERIAAASLSRVAVLGSILDALAAAGVGALPYKGPTLSDAAYGDAGARDSVDLDIIVPPSAAHAAEDVLRSLRFAPPAGLSAVQRRAIFGPLGATPWRRTADAVAVELHSRVCESRLPWALGFDGMWSRAHVAANAGSARRTIGNEDNVLLLAWHGSRHAWSQLEWIASWGALASGASLDWARIEAVAVQHGGRRALRLGVAVARDIGIPLPAAPPTDEPFAADLAYLREGWEHAVHRDDAVYRRFLFRLLERAADRAQFALLTAFAPTEREWESVRLPDALAWAYPLVRVARLALRGH